MRSTQRNFFERFLYILVIGVLWVGSPLKAQQTYNIPITRAAGNQFGQQVVPTNDLSGVFVLWLDNRSKKLELFGQFLNAQGIPLLENGARVLNRPNPILSFAMATDGDGGFYVAWLEKATVGSELFIQRFLKSGDTAWVQPVQLGKSNRVFLNPHIVNDLGTGVYVAWDEAVILNNNVISANTDIM
ncbi:MAG: hypothetical protein D6814_15035, partial [Calditrichaeota bacterium]